MHRSLKAVLFKLCHGYELECIGMRGFQHHRRRNFCFHRLPPPKGAQAPSVAWIQAGKAVLRNSRDQVVACSL